MENEKQQKDNKHELITLKKKPIKDIAIEVIQKIEDALKQKDEVIYPIYLLPLKYELGINNFNFVLRIVCAYFEYKGYRAYLLYDRLKVVKPISKKENSQQ